MWASLSPPHTHRAELTKASAAFQTAFKKLIARCTTTKPPPPPLTEAGDKDDKE